MRRLIGGTHGSLIDEVLRSEHRDHFANRRRRQLNDEVEIVRRARDSPIIARHRSGQVISDLGAVQSLETIDEKFLLRHGRTSCSRS